VGSDLILKGWTNVTETVGIQLRATSHDNAVFLLRYLRQVLSRAVFDVPCMLVVQPDGATNNVYYQIYHADVQETPDYLKEARSGAYIFRAAITWTRSPFGSTTGTGLIAINAGSFANLGTGSPDNVEAFASLAGDLIYEGQPTNISVDPAAAAVICLASVHNRTYSTTESGNKTTSSTTGATATMNTPAVDIVASNNALRGRCLMRLTNSTTSNSQLRVEMRVTSSGALLFAGPWCTPTSGIATVVDCGGVPLDAIRSASGALSTIQLSIGYRSTNGASTTVGLASNDWLLYYDFCRVDATIAVGTRLDLNCLPGVGDRPNISSGVPVALVTSGGTLIDRGLCRGTAPHVRQGASLYVAWLQSGDVHSSADTASVTVRYGPQFYTLR
jgi:hypothetical protein